MTPDEMLHAMTSGLDDYNDEHDVFYNVSSTTIEPTTARCSVNTVDPDSGDVLDTFDVVVERR